MSSSGPRREVAYRLFAEEFNASTYTYAESDEERAPKYLVTPTGARVNRLFVVGVLTEVEEVSDDVVRARVVDPTGAFVIYAGQYQPEALAFFERAEPPVFVAVTGKARTFQPDGSDRVFTSLRPESVNEVDADTRDRWVVQTAEHTLERVAIFGKALEHGARGSDLRSVLKSAGVQPGIASGIPRAIEQYETTTAYLESIQEMAIDAARLVAGEIDAVERTEIAPDEGGHQELDTSFATDVILDDVTGDEVDSVEPEVEPDTEAEADAEAEVEDESATDADAVETPEVDDTVESDVEEVVEEEDVASEAAVEDEPVEATESEAAAESPSEPDEAVEEIDEDTEEDPPEEAEVETDEMYELSDEERAEVEENFDVGFESGAEIESPDSEEAPEPEPSEDEREPEGEPDEVAAEPENEETHSDTEGLEEAAEPEDEAIEPDEEEDEAEPDGAPADEAEVDAADLTDAELEDAVIEIMKEEAGGDGIERETLVEAVDAEYGVGEEAIEEAIQNALLGGRCFESGDDQLKPI